MVHGLLLFLLGVALLPGQDVAVREEMRTFPTYDEAEPDPNPQFDAFYGDIFPNYPYTIRNPINKKSSPAAWRVVVLENEYLSCRILPDLGGHLHGCTDKITGREIFYSNPVIRITQESKRREFVATGIESSFPMAHGRVTGSPVNYAWDLRAGVGRVVVEDTDRTSGMQWRVEFVLRPGVATLEQRATIYNGSEVRRGYQWWVNAAVELDDPHLRIVYPVKWMMPHGDGAMTAWPIAGGVDLSDAANYRTQTGLFAHLSREPWMALYKPKFRSGVAHYANLNTLRGKKIWVWGKDWDDYVKQNLTENFNSYVEMQAGELESQPEFTFLLPGQSKTFDHYWIPFHDLGGVARATPDAVLNLDRKGNRVTVELQGTHVMKGLTLRLSDGGKVIWQGVVDLGPRVKYAQPLEAGKLTVDLMGANGKVLLHQVENEYDSTPFDSQAANPEPTVPGRESDSEPVALARGAYNEERDLWAFAWNDYQRALKITPESARLRLAAGRTAIALKRYDEAIRLLKELANGQAEAAYYYGVALASKSERVAEAESALTLAAKDKLWADAANLQEALLLARERGAEGKVQAARSLQALAAKPGAAAHLGGLEVALLRQIGKTEEAKSRLRFWLQQDPANDLLRVERTLNGGADDVALWNHLAADPERLLRVAEDYRNIGDCADAVSILDRRYTAQPATQKEPGKVLPQDYPLVAYFRGYCRLTLGEDARADFVAASKLSTLYVFPHKELDYRVLGAALAQNDADAVAHDLLGDLYFDSLQVTEAISEWKKALALKNDLPALHRNLGLALLNFAKDPAAAKLVLLEGRRLTPDDAEIAEALRRIEPTADQPADSAAKRARARPEPPAGTGPAPILEEVPSGGVAARALVRSVSDANSAIGEFNPTAFPQDKQPDSVKQAFVEVQLQRLMVLARTGKCSEARPGLEDIGQMIPWLPFTYAKFNGFMKSSHFQYYMGVVESLCGDEKAAKKRWMKVSKNIEPADSMEFVFPLLAAKRLGDNDAESRIQAATQGAQKTMLDKRLPAQVFVQGALLLAEGKSDQGSDVLRTLATDPDSFVRYMSLAMLVEGERK